jgi:glycosyltransferase involved in cell wall biosynthesis
VILEVRNAVIGLNASLFSQFTQIKCANPKIANELNRYLNIQSEVSYAPPQYLEVARESESSPVFNSYFFFPGEIGPNGRHELMIRAMQKIDSQIKLVIAGSVRKPEYYESLQKTVADLRLQERVQFIARNISQSEEMKQYQTCLASIQFASQNDYDSVSLESFCFKKPVITLKDVESNLETVIDQKTGIRVGTHPDELAQSVNLLARQKGLPSQLGEQGYKKLQSMDLSWKRVIGDFNL